MRFRLGQHLCLEGQQCGNRYVTTTATSRTGDRCQGRLDAHGHHAATCMVGGCRKRTHNALRDPYVRDRREEKKEQTWYSVTD